jgi:hypothetical protein
MYLAILVRKARASALAQHTTAAQPWFLARDLAPAAPCRAPSRTLLSTAHLATRQPMVGLRSMRARAQAAT